MLFKKGRDMSGEKNSFYGRKHSPESKAKMRLAALGRTLSLEAREKLSKAFKGKPGHPCSAETKLKLSKTKKGKRVSIRTEFKKGLVPWNKNKGHLCSENTILRQRLDYRDWRLSVWERDDFTCNYCGKRGGKIHAHHLIAFAKHQENRFDINNGLTLCLKCHKIFHFGGEREGVQLSTSL